MSCHVYIERPVDPSPSGERALAHALAQRYRLPEEQVAMQLATGRLRVKSNVDEKAAHELVRELESLAAVCSVVDAATGATISSATASPAFGEMPGISIASLSTEPALSSPPSMDDPRFQPAPERRTTANPFAAPDAQAEAPLELAIPRAGKPPSAPSVEISVLPPPAVVLSPAPKPTPERKPTLPSGSLHRPFSAFFAARDRLRLAVGFGLALSIGYLPATLYASSAEDARYTVIKKELIERQSRSMTHEEWQSLDEERQLASVQLRGARSRIRTVTGMVWVLVGIGVGLAWFKKLT